MTKPSFYNGSERTDYAEFQEDSQNDRPLTVGDPETGEHLGPDATRVETDDEGFARTHGVQEVPPELQGYVSLPGTIEDQDG